MTGRLLVLGCGSLAREVILALPSIAQQHRDQEFTVIVAARNAGKAAWIAQLGRARSYVAQVAVNFIPRQLDWDSTDHLASLIAAAAPTAILNAASLQSPWELNGSNAWTRLIKAGGYGVTVPLQAALLPRLGRALRQARVNVPVVNACYPDVVNAGGSRMGLEILCGVGNIAILAELLRQHFTEIKKLRLLAGLPNVDEFARPPEERSDLPMVWDDERRLPSAALADAPSLCGDATINAFAAGTSADILHSVATQRDWIGHLPGPLGELGGYPVRFQNRAITLDLPSDLTLHEARAWNLERCERAGAVVEDAKRVRFSANAANLIGAVAPDLAKGFDFQDVEKVADEFIKLRSALSARP